MKKGCESCRFLPTHQNTLLRGLLLTVVVVSTRRCHAFAPVVVTTTPTKAQPFGDTSILSRPLGGWTRRAPSLQLYDPSWSECIGDSYAYCLDNFYLPTQAMTGALCATLGDVIAQYEEAKEQQEEAYSYDPVRTFHYFLKGIGGGIMWAYWFDYSEPLSTGMTRSVMESMHMPSGTLSTSSSEEIAGALLAERATRTAISILLEQFLVSPLLFTFWDIPLPALLRGTPMRQIPNQVQSKLGPLLVANAKVWTIVNVVTYNIPVEYRVLFASCADILWQSINAGITSQEVSTAELPPVLVLEEADEELSRVGLFVATNATSSRSSAPSMQPIREE